MTAGGTNCSCTICGTSCTGRFAGCAAVWARGPREVALDMPRVAHQEPVRAASDFSLGEDSDARWRLPLEPLTKPMTPMAPPVIKAPAPVAPEPVPAASNGAHTDNGNAASSPVMADVVPETPAEIGTSLESPDITARFAVAQLAELNERVEELTKLATETTEVSLEKVHSELRRITSLREVDLTEQASGIFSAVQAGTDALEAFASTVREVTDDLRLILTDALAAIGGSEGLAARVSEAQADVISIREDFGAALARIERDLSVMRQRLPAKGATAAAAGAAKISEQQINVIIDSVSDAVTEAVIGTLNAEGARGRRR